MYPKIPVFAQGPFLLISLVGALVVSCDSGNVYKPPPAPEVTVDHPVQGEVIDSIDFTGNTQAYMTVKLLARVEGYLEKVLFREGDVVEEGQTLFIIQQESYIAKLKEAEANLLSSKAKLAHSETEYKRFTGLMREDAAAQTDVDHWRYERDSNQAAVMGDEAQVAIAKLNLSYTVVKAPFRGKVSRRYYDPGNVVGKGENTVLAEINRIDPLYVYFTISERDLLKIREHRSSRTNQDPSRPPNVPVSVGLANEEGYPHQAVLDYSDIQVDTATGTLQLRATLPNPDLSVIPGLFVRIRAEESALREGLLIPRETVAYDQAGPFVLVVDDQGVVSRRGVRLGSTMNQQVVVESGLSASDWMIVNGQMRAIPGKKVTPKQREEKRESNTP